MIRRLTRPRPPVTVDQYVHLATVGLPKTERLDTATELRAHLLERVTEYEDSGYSREEAEFLAVQAMGEVQTTNRELLGHFFSHRLGWLTLIVLLVGGGAWAAYRASQWEGVRLAEASPQDDTATLQFPREIWPSSAATGLRRSAEVRFPKGTQTVFAALLTKNAPGLRPSFSWYVPFAYDYSADRPVTWEPTAADSAKFWGGHFRLLSAAAPDQGAGATRCRKGEAVVGNFLYGLNTYQPRVEGITWRKVGDLTYTANLASGICFPNTASAMRLHASALPLNTWTMVADLPAGSPGGEATLALLLYPSSAVSALPTSTPEHSYTYDAVQKHWIRR